MARTKQEEMRKLCKALDKKKASLMGRLQTAIDRWGEFRKRLTINMRGKYTRQKNLYHQERCDHWKGRIEALEAEISYEFGESTLLAVRYPRYLTA